MAIENHPIPQDVTGFKFKLVGSITVKQFGYLMGGGVLATLVFLLPGSFFIRVPFMGLFLLVGLALSFVPIDGRPMDKMIMNFIKTIPSENEYIYHKKGVNLSLFEYLQPPKVVPVHPQKVVQAAPVNTDSAYRKNLFMAELRKTSYKPDQEEMAYMKNIKSFFDNPAAQGPIFAASPAPTQKPVSPLNQPVYAEQTAPQPASVVQPPAPSFQAQPVRPSQVMQKPTPQFVPQPISPIQAQPVTQPAPVIPQTLPVAQQPQISPQPEGKPVSPSATVRVVKADSQLQAGFPTIPDVANVILGIIKDPRGKVLPNIIVEVVDQNSTPVRAFKTNALGQFAAATPLPNGTYTVSFEDTMHKNEFRSITITLNGGIFQPIEIISIDQREKLRQELFGTVPSA